MKRSTLTFALFALLSCATGASGTYDEAPLPKDTKIDRLVIYKSDGRMEAWAGDDLAKVYEIAIGKGGAGHKRHRGDGRTPEGTYQIDSRHRSKRFHRFLHISYPNAKDRKRFRQARASGEIPAGVGIGGAIGIHGEKNGREGLPHKLFDWTQGCIALDNEEIEELFAYVQKGARVEILP